MDDDNTGVNLTRRKALAAIGSIGVASAGAGLGTSAYFSDQETFENNQLTAGTLDMQVSATEYYSDWSSDEAAVAGMAANASSTDIRLPAGAGQADARDIAIDIDGDNYAAFFDAISSAGPTPSDDPYNRVNGGVSAASDGLCGTGSDADGPVVIDIADVKPGDFGGAQFAFELCDNPGYVWLTGGLEAANENRTTEPEADDPNEDADTVELLDEIQVTYGIGPINDGSTAFEDTASGFQPVEQYTLREFLAMLGGDGIALDGDIDAELGGGTGEQGCFSGGNPSAPSVHEVSVIWWLPIDHGNQVQSDSVTFDLGFYTEQCRHNDGETDLVAYYPFERSADDVSGNEYDGTLNGDVSFTNGKIGQAASFDGDGDYIAAPGAYASTPVSVAAWFRVDGSGTQNPRIVGTNDSSFRLLLDGGYKDGDNSISFDILNGGPQTDSPSSVDDGNWHQVVATYDGSTARLYLDGSEVDSASAAATSTNSGLWIGSKNGSADFFEGAIDDVRIYSRALSTSEVQSLYDSA
ncbi:MAG: LamG-like jellyroll fold domain-containing protein [Haloplanus sp.]